MARVPDPLPGAPGTCIPRTVHPTAARLSAVTIVSEASGQREDGTADIARVSLGRTPQAFAGHVEDPAHGQGHGEAEDHENRHGRQETPRQMHRFLEDVGRLEHAECRSQVQRGDPEYLTAPQLADEPSQPSGSFSPHSTIPFPSPCLRFPCIAGPALKTRIERRRLRPASDGPAIDTAQWSREPALDPEQRGERADQRMPAFYLGTWLHASSSPGPRIAIGRQPRSVPCSDESPAASLRSIARRPRPESAGLAPAGVGSRGAGAACGGSRRRRGECPTASRRQGTGTALAGPSENPFSDAPAEVGIRSIPIALQVRRCFKRMSSRAHDRVTRHELASACRRRPFGG